MAANFSVRLAKESLVFSAAHFITYGDGICERLHGHNYRVAVEVAGPLEKNQYVVDFVWLRKRVAAIVAELDHRVLLPTKHPQIRVIAAEESVEATFEERRWEFPREDCVLLPVENTTAEKLAEYIGQRLLANFREQRVAAERVRVEVDECFGQIGVCELSEK
jgi:6-pyruvoyltetrahydropterin/6-carboxytetrahydropterin synthase